ncbi:MAG: NFACT RNA binding domain-containing protein [Syntrophomonas sp.]|nr:NFACT RNA binding domain-containing protein [Syntrophomonas sp.]
MPFDGLAVRAISRELDERLKDARIDKVYQPEKDELVFSIRPTQGGTMRLLISANPKWARIHLTEQRKPNPTHPPSFCMLLRKYLEGGKIKEIKQLGMERIIQIRIEAMNDFREWQDKYLVCEFMGRHSNIILVNPATNLVLDAIKRINSEMSSYREVMPGREYLLPPSQGKLEPLSADFESFAAALYQQDENLDAAAALFNIYTGLSSFSAGQICDTAGLPSGIAVGECGEFEMTRLFQATRDLIDSIDQGLIQPTVQYKKLIPIEFAPYFFRAGNESDRLKSFPSANDAYDAFFSQKLAQLKLQSLQDNLARKINEHLQKAYRKKFLQEGDLSQAGQKDLYKTWGELLTSYAHRFKKGDAAAVVPDFITGEDISLPLDVRYTPIQNAQRFFKIYNKAQGAKRHLVRMMKETQDGIDYLESVLVAVKQAESPAEIEEIIEELEKEKYLRAASARSKKQARRSTPRQFLSSDSLTIRVGRNNLQNDRLTLKESKRTDLWLHTQRIPGSHVIISLPPHITSIDQVPDRTLEEAAGLAARFSQASTAAKVPVDYTFRSNVKKPGGARPGMVTYDNYWTLLADPAVELVEQASASASADTKP